MTDDKDELRVEFSTHRDGGCVFAVCYEEDGRVSHGWSAEDWLTLFRLMQPKKPSGEGDTMTDDTKPDHEEARRLAEGLILIGHSAEPKYSNLAEAYLASQAENAELRQLVGGEFLEASKDKALTEARSDRDALHRALGEVCGWLESRDPKPQLHAAESLQNARALLKSTRVLTTPGEGT